MLASKVSPINRDGGGAWITCQRCPTLGDYDTPEIRVTKLYDQVEDANAEASA